MSDDTVLVFDLETVPDVEAFATAEKLTGHPAWSVRRQMGEKVARQVFQRIVCIGVLMAARAADGAWQPTVLEASHGGDTSERARNMMSSGKGLDTRSLRRSVRNG